jgi:hypothetical protein
MQTMKTSAKGTSALVFHAQDGITAVDPFGVIRVMDDRPDRDPHNYYTNCFHVFTGECLDPRSSSTPTVTGCSIVDAYMLNGLDRPLFLACAADGAAYVWEKCAHHPCARSSYCTFMIAACAGGRHSDC